MKCGNALLFAMVGFMLAGSTDPPSQSHHHYGRDVNHSEMLGVYGIGFTTLVDFQLKISSINYRIIGSSETGGIRQEFGSQFRHVPKRTKTS